MLKKNQLVLILLTLVLMLSVFYITSPWKGNEKDNENPNDGQVSAETGRLEELQSLRVVLNDERAAQVLGLDAIIADTNKTVNEKSQALDEKHYLNGLTEKELLLEVQIIGKGYRDAFVHATLTGVEITVVAEENSVKIANEIIMMAINGFDKTFDNVTVNFQTAAQVMGNA